MKKNQLISKQNATTIRFSEQEARIIAAKRDNVPPEIADIYGYFERSDDGWYYEK